MWRHVTCESPSRKTPKKLLVELIVKKDAVHGWAGMDKDIALFADWFDKQLFRGLPGG